VRGSLGWFQDPAQLDHASRKVGVPDVLEDRLRPDQIDALIGNTFLAL
jgi:hypothetical protein